MNKMAWKVWAPPKVNFFAWLAIRNRIWTANCRERRGWDNCRLCPLCIQIQETAAHLISQCRYTKRLWNMVKSWLGIPSVCTHEWAGDAFLREWCKMMLCNAMESRKVMSSITVLVTWTIWKERNARVFNNKFAPPTILLQIIKDKKRRGCEAFEFYNKGE
jgi:hypothetical protein